MRGLSVLLCVLVAGLAGVSALAEEALSPAEKLLHLIEEADVLFEAEKEAWRDYPAAPAEEALVPDVLKRYRALLDREDCEAVLPLLFDAYLTRHPKIRGAFVSGKVVRSWIGTVVDNAYPEHDFCEAKKGLAEELTRLRSQRVEPLPYEGIATQSALDRPEEMRNHFLRRIEGWAKRDHVPAIHFYLGLGSDPQLLGIPPDDRVYLLRRLRILGAPLPDQDAREAAAAAALPQGRVRQVLCWAEKAPDQSPEAMRECFKEREE